MSPEDLFTHGTLKLQVAGKIEARVAELDLGHAFVGETRVSSIAGNVSAEPDVVVISHDALDEGRVTLVPKATGEQGRYVEIEGAVDLIVEIVSDSSVRKDTQRLPAAYYRAGVRENWLIDARGEQLGFPSPAAWCKLLRNDARRCQRISAIRSPGLPGSPRPPAPSAWSLGLSPYVAVTSSGATGFASDFPAKPLRPLMVVDFNYEIGLIRAASKVLTLMRKDCDVRTKPILISAVPIICLARILCTRPGTRGRRRQPRARDRHRWRRRPLSAECRYALYRCARLPTVAFGTIF